MLSRISPPVLVALACAWAHQAQAGNGGPVFELDLDDPSEIVPAELLLDLESGLAPQSPAAPAATAGRPAGSNPAKSAVTGKSREEQLDQALASMLAGRNAPMPNDGHRGAPRPGPGQLAGPPPAALEMMRQLFPGPLIIEEDGAPSRASPLSAPDPLVMDMLEDMNAAFQDAILPAVHRMPTVSGAPDSCGADLRAHCGKARSQLHCLGQHAAEIAPRCREDVGKAVPFLCSQAIDRWCDVLHSGVLPCLSARLEALGGSCRDAVLATQAALSQASGGASSTTLAKLPPSAGSSAHAQHEARLDAKLGTALAQGATAAPAAAAAASVTTTTGARQAPMRLGAPAARVPEASKPSGTTKGSFRGANPLPSELNVKQEVPEEPSPFRFLGLALALLAVAGCVGGILSTPGLSTKALTSLKAFAGEDSQPLRGGIKLEKPSAF